MLNILFWLTFMTTVSLNVTGVWQTDLHLLFAIPVVHLVVVGFSNQLNKIIRLLEKK